MDIQCFWVDRIQFAVRYLRRYRSEPECSIQSPDKVSCCDGMVYLDRLAYEGDCLAASTEIKHDHPLWPKSCAACGYQFQDSDEWQEFLDWLYVDRLTGQIYELRKLPSGAMFDSHWLRDRKGADGVHLTIKLPDGRDWHVDGPSYNDGNVGPGWNRTGTIPRVTATPSILTPGYHGWLRDGVLVQC